MSRNPLTSFLKKAVLSAIEKETGNSIQRSESRRKFLHDTAFAAGGLALLPTFLQSMPVTKKVVIIGAGIAGLNACYQLKKQGIPSIVYEASDRVGGRMFTMKNEMGDGLTTDIGGEFVDTSHTDVLELLREFNLPLYDLREDKAIPKELFFDGKHLSGDDLKNALAPFVKQLVADIKTLPEKISYQTADAFRHLDEQSITGYISGIGISGWLYDFINVVLTREYGMESSQQSAINFLIMFTAPTDSTAYYEMFGDDHEVFKIQGGSQRLTDTLYEKVKDNVVLQHKLTGISKDLQSGYRLSLENNKTEKSIQADFIILAIPFTILRKIAWHVPMPPGKRKCIDEMGYGNSCKFVMGFDGRPWRDANRQGYTFTDIYFGCGWDSAQSQPGNKGSFTVFGGGDFGEGISKKPTAELQSDFIAGLEKIYPGAQKMYNGKNIKFCWEKNPLSGAGYSSFKKGQWSTLAGWESVPVGDIYFAGEHVSRDFQGYMNGGAQTARIAAEKIAERFAPA